MKRVISPAISLKFVAGLLFLWFGVILGFSISPSHVLISRAGTKNGAWRQDEDAHRWNHHPRVGTGSSCDRNLSLSQIRLVLQLFGSDKYDNADDAGDDDGGRRPRRGTDFFIRPAHPADMGRASQILADGFFKGKVNFLQYQWERLETYLSLEASFPRPNALHQLYVACDSRSGRVLGLAEVDVRPSKTTPQDGRAVNRDTGKDNQNSIGGSTGSSSSIDGPYMCNLAVDAQYQRQGIASALIQKCEHQVQDWYAQRGGGSRAISCSLYLKVRASNQAAIEMYSKADYMSFRQEKDEKSGDTILVMRKELPRTADAADARSRSDMLLSSNTSNKSKSASRAARASRAR